MKNIFKAEHLLACSGLLLLLGGCTPDPLELDNSTTSGVAMQAPKGGGNDDEVGSMSYMLVATAELPADIAAKVTAAGGTLVKVMPEIGVAVVEANAAGFETKAAGISGIRSVIPDFDLQWIPKETLAADDNAVSSPPNSTEADPLFNLQWGHDAVNAPEAWEAGYMGEGAVVAVLDGGFHTTHPDLAANVLHDKSMSFIAGEPVEFDPALTRLSHGTHVAGTIAAARNGIGVIGVAPQAKVMLVKVLRDAGSGPFSGIVAGILYAANNGADVINMSLGAALPRNGQFFDADGNMIKYPSNLINELILPMQKAITYANQKGVTVIAAAGNDGNNGQTDGSMVYLPSDLTNVLSISATGPVGWIKNPATDLDVLASYSNYGNKVDFAAPGGNFDYYYQVGLERCEAPIMSGQHCFRYDMVYSLTGNGLYAWAAGTSMASPHAAGVAALIVGKHGGNIKPAQVEAILKKSADDIFKVGRDPLSGHGRVNAFRAVMQ